MSDDERREVARRLRDKKAECEERGYPWMCDDLILALGYDHDYEAGDEIFDRLADLIDPGDMSQGRRDAVACDREAPETCEHWLDGECYALRTVRPVDRETLLALADKARKLGDEEGGPASYAVRCTFRVFARDIYKALGEVVA